jgi:hypothetical protein
MEQPVAWVLIQAMIGQEVVMGPTYWEKSRACAVAMLQLE